MEIRKDVLSGKLVTEHESFYKKYFTSAETPKRGAEVSVKQDVVDKTKRYYGYFALLTNEKMDTITALQLYRNMDLIE